MQSLLQKKYSHRSEPVAAHAHRLYVFPNGSPYRNDESAAPRETETITVTGTLSLNGEPRFSAAADRDDS